MRCQRCQTTVPYPKRQRKTIFCTHFLHYSKPIPMKRLKSWTSAVKPDYPEKHSIPISSTKKICFDYLAQIISLCYSATDDKSGHYHYFNFFYHMQKSVALLLKNNLWYDVTKRTTRQYTDLLYPHNWKQILGEQYQNKDLFLEFMSYGSARLIELWCEHGFKENPEDLCALVEKIQSGF